MENNDKALKTSRPVSLLLLIPALLFGIISFALAIVGLGLIPILPALVSVLLAIISMLLFKKSYRVFTIVILSISIFASVVSVFRGAIIGAKVATDTAFDSTMVKTQVGIEGDLNDAFGDDSEKVKNTNDTLTNK